jgi:hypothetical protein
MASTGSGTGMVTISLVVPEEKLADVYAAVAKAIAVEQSAGSGDGRTADPLWDPAEWRAVIDKTYEREEQLLLRMADARGHHVPIGELSRDLGLPAEADLDRDFPALCARAGDRTRPVAVGGEGEGGWYAMSAENAAMLRKAFAEKKAEKQQADKKQKPEKSQSGSGQ